MWSVGLFFLGKMTIYHNLGNGQEDTCKRTLMWDHFVICALTCLNVDSVDIPVTLQNILIRWTSESTSFFIFVHKPLMPRSSSGIHPTPCLPQVLVHVLIHLSLYIGSKALPCCTQAGDYPGVGWDLYLGSGLIIVGFTLVFFPATLWKVWWKIPCIS